MMRVCVFCGIRYQKGSGITFHKFPTDTVTKQLWVENMKMKNWSPKNNDHLCIKHFTDDCFVKHVTRTTLRNGSVPTLFFVNTPEREDMITPTLCVSQTAGAKREFSCINDYPENTHLDVNTPKREDMITPTLSVSQTAGIKREFSCINDYPENTHFDVNTPKREDMITPTLCVSQTAGVKREFNCINDYPESTYFNVNTPKREDMITPTLFVSQTAGIKREFSCISDYPENTHFDVNTPKREDMITPTLSVSQTAGVKREFSCINDYPENTHFDEAGTSEPQKKSRTIPEGCENIEHVHHYVNAPSRSISEVCTNIRHDHSYENTPKSKNETMQRVKKSLNKSRARVKVLSQHVKRLKITVSSLKTILADKKKEVD